MSVFSCFLGRVGWEFQCDLNKMRVGLLELLILRSNSALIALLSLQEHQHLKCISRLGPLHLTGYYSFQLVVNCWALSKGDPFCARSLGMDNSCRMCSCATFIIFSKIYTEEPSADCFFLPSEALDKEPLCE